MWKAGGVKGTWTDGGAALGPNGMVYLGQGRLWHGCNSQMIAPRRSVIFEECLKLSHVGEIHTRIHVLHCLLQLGMFRQLQFQGARRMYL